MAAFLATFTPLLADHLKQRAELDRVEVPALIWLSAMHAYTRMRRQGIPMLAVRYEELVAEPRRMLETILDYLGLRTDRVTKALRAFEHDSQAGSPLSREAASSHSVHIDSRRWDLIRDLVQRDPIPGTDIPNASFALP